MLYRCTVMLCGCGCGCGCGVWCVCVVPFPVFLACIKIQNTKDSRFDDRRPNVQGIEEQYS